MPGIAAPDGIEGARALFPAWMAWGNLVAFPTAAAFCSAVATGVSLLVAGGAGSRRGPWPERARRCAGVRCTVALLPWFLLFVVARGAHAWVGPIGRSAPSVIVGAGMIASWVTIWSVVYVFDRWQADKPSSYTWWLRGQAAAALVFQWPLLIAVLSMNWLASGESLLTTAIAIAPVLLFFLLGGGWWIVRRLGALGPASPRLLTAVQRAATLTGITPRAIHELLIPHHNAYALPSSRTVLMCPPLSDELSDDELTAISAHELGHFSHGRWLRFGLRLVPWALPAALISPLLGSVFFIPAAIGLLFVSGKIMGQAQAEADAVASAAVGEAAYLRSLEAVHRVALLPVTTGGATARGCSLFDRMTAAGVEPGYPRPAPPSPGKMFLASLAPVVAMHLSSTALSDWPADWGNRHRRVNWVQTVLVGLTGGSADTFIALGHQRTKRGDSDAAISLYRAATIADTHDVYVRTMLTTALAYAGKCPDAVSVARQSQPLVRTRADRAWFAQSRAFAHWCRVPTAGPGTTHGCRIPRHGKNRPRGDKDIPPV